MHATRRELLKATIPAAGALLIGKTAIGADVTRDDILAEIDALRANVVLYPGDSQVKADLLTAIDNLRLLAATLPDPPPQGPIEIVVNAGETRIIEGAVAVTNIHVKAGGTLLVLPGSDVSWADLPLDTADTEQMGRGLIVEGTIRANGTFRTRRLRLEGPLVAGDTTIELQGDPIGWQVGDTLVLPDTRQKRTQATIDPTSQSETVTVMAISGRQVSITPAQFGHSTCALDATLTPHVANLTCDVVFRSANPAGTRAHAICLCGATVDLSHCEFRDMGRTDKSRPLDSQTNRIGRYPLHLHEMGDTTARVEGVVVRGSPGWGIAVHATHGAYVGHCVAYDGVGSAFIAEDGTEHDNLFADNTAIRWRNGRAIEAGGVSRFDDPHTGLQVLDVGFDGSGFWMRGIGNDVRGNVAADCQFVGYSRNGYYNPIAAANVPMPGADDGNEAYACGGGLWLTWPQTGKPQSTWPEHVTSNFTAWHVNQFAIEAWHTMHETFQGCRLLNDPAISSTSSASANLFARVNYGFQPGPTYECGGTLIEDCEIRGFNFGVRLPAKMRDMPDVSVRNTLLSNYVNIVATQCRDTRNATLEGVQFVPSGMTRPAHSGWASVPEELDILMRLSSDNIPLVTDQSAIKLLDTSETVYFKEDVNAPCMTERARIVGYACEGTP